MTEAILRKSQGWGPAMVLTEARNEGGGPCLAGRKVLAGAVKVLS